MMPQMDSQQSYHQALQQGFEDNVLFTPARFRPQTDSSKSSAHNIAPYDYANVQQQQVNPYAGGHDMFYQSQQSNFTMPVGFSGERESANAYFRRSSTS